MHKHASDLSAVSLPIDGYRQIALCLPSLMGLC